MACYTNFFPVRVLKLFINLIQIKTDKAIAFVNPMTHTEAYRPESSFSDAVKGFVLYGGKIVRPKEMINLNVYK